PATRRGHSRTPPFSTPMAIKASRPRERGKAPRGLDPTRERVSRNSRDRAASTTSRAGSLSQVVDHESTSRPHSSKLVRALRESMALVLEDHVLDLASLR